MGTREKTGGWKKAVAFFALLSEAHSRSSIDQSALIFGFEKKRAHLFPTRKTHTDGSHDPRVLLLRGLGARQSGA